VEVEEDVRRPKRLIYNTLNKEDVNKIDNIFIEFPYIETLVPVIDKLPPSIFAYSGTYTPLKTTYSIGVKWNVDNYNKTLTVYDDKGIEKVYKIDSINSSNLKTGKSLDKKEVVELANYYLKLNIKPQNKKSEFVKAIREKVGLSPE
jgi:hypothetical protein